MDRGERFDTRRLEKTHRSRHGDLAQIITFDIQDHRQLGPLLGTLVELAAQLGVRFGVVTSRARPLDGRRFDPSRGRIEGQKKLGRGRADERPTEIETCAESRRRDLGHSEVEIERAPLHGESLPSSEVHLVEIACSNEILRSTNALDVGSLPPFFELLQTPSLNAACERRRAELAGQFGDAADRRRLR
jgi:hypothetical protein